MTKVMVIGNAAGGKSTLCRTLSAMYALPYFSIDKIQWKPGWIQTPGMEYNELHNKIIGGERWLIDGYGSWKSVLQRMNAVDTIILVDHPIWVHYWWATKRQVKSLFWSSPDTPNGCSMWPVTFRMYKMIWWWHVHQRQRLIHEACSRANSVQVIHIASPLQLSQFISNPV